MVWLNISKRFWANSFIIRFQQSLISIVNKNEDNSIYNLSFMPVGTNKLFQLRFIIKLYESIKYTVYTLKDIN